MKILIVIPYFIPAISYGGPVKVSYDIARGLVARGHEVTVATTDVFDDKKRMKKSREIIDGISVERFYNVSNLLAKRCNGYLPLFFIPWFLRNHSQYDVVYCNDFFSVLAITVGISSRFRKFPILVQPHGSLSSVRRAAGRG